MADEIGELIPDLVQLYLGDGAFDAGPSALGGVYVDADFPQAVLADERDEVVWLFEKALPVAHDHGV